MANSVTPSRWSASTPQLDHHPSRVGLPGELSPESRHGWVQDATDCLVVGVLLLLVALIAFL